MRSLDRWENCEIFTELSVMKPKYLTRKRTAQNLFHAQLPPEILPRQMDCHRESPMVAEHAITPVPTLRKNRMLQMQFGGPSIKVNWVKIMPICLSL
jgi:hypothetical protein